MAAISQTTCAIMQSYFSTELIRADDKTTATWHAHLNVWFLFYFIKIPLEFVPNGPSKGMSGLV